jgi:hypothetical protein
MPSIETKGFIYYGTGLPGAGTDCIQTITIGGAPTEVAGSGFYLFPYGIRTPLILWSSTNATLVANIDAALEAKLGTGAVVTAVGVATLGIGTITVTFSGTDYAKRVVPLMTVLNRLTATGTVAVTNTTPGVDAGFLGAPKGALVNDINSAKIYKNTGTEAAPVWTDISV